MTRSKPFSGKQKKLQLQQKKDRKRIEDAIEIEKDGNISLYEKRKLAQKIIGERDQGRGQGRGRGRGQGRGRGGHSRGQSSTTSDDDDDEEEEEEDEIDEDENEDEEDTQEEEDEIDEDEEEEEEEEEEEDSNEDDEDKKKKKNIHKAKRNVHLLTKQLKENDIISNNNKDKDSNKQRTRNNLVTIFEKETREEIQQRKEQGKLPLDTKFRESPWKILEEHRFDDRDEDSGNYIDIPKRPKWDFDMSKEEEKKQEQIMFKKWLDSIVSKYDPSRLNYFEHNLEVWRQLWRVCERSDIILLVTDARYPLFHFPPALYHYIKDELKKPMLMVLNKVDLVDKRIVDAWIHYFNTNYSWVKIICFSSFRPLDTAHRHDMDVSKRRKFKKGRKNYGLAGGKKQLIEAILSFNIMKKDLDMNEIVNKKKEYEEEKEKEEEEEEEEDEEESDDDSDDDDESDHKQIEEEEEEEEITKQKDNNRIIIGTVGHPNVGKSSLINGLMGKKVVSTSRTPGHTKYFQTIHLTKGIVLCDCPGLVFPALDRPKSLQILCGLYPIAQVREPYSAIRYLADRVPIEKVYGLQHPDIEDEPGKRPGPWSPYSICQALARKRGYFVAKSGREDVHRAGLEILRDCVDGNIVISWPPPDFTKEKYQEIMSVKHTDYLSNEGKGRRGGDSTTTTDRVEKTRSERKEEKKIKRNKQLASALANRDSSDSDDDDDDDDDNDSDDNDHFDNRKKKGGAIAHNRKSIVKESPPSPPPTSVSAKGKKKISAKAQAYAEKLAEKQGKGGNHRQQIG